MPITTKDMTKSTMSFTTISMKITRLNSCIRETKISLILEESKPTFLETKLRKKMASNIMLSVQRIKKLAQIRLMLLILTQDILK